MAVMLYEIATIALLLTICSASPLQPQYNPQQAVSSQSFVRHDVPLSYKHSAVHVYTTERAEYQKDVPKIQYAPLYLPDDLRVKSELNTKVYHESDVTNQNRNIRKDHLEPKEHSGTVKTRGYITYIPGHNIELLQSVNRSPGLYTDFRNNPTTPSDVNAKSTEKVNYHRAFSVFTRPQNLQNPSPHPQEVAASRPPHYDPNNQYNRIVNPAALFNPNTYQIPPPINLSLEQQSLRNQQRLEDIHQLSMQIEAQKVSSYPKTNTLLLNLARAYNSQTPINNDNNYLDNIQNKLQNRQALFKGPAIKLTPDHGSHLLSIGANPQMFNGHQ